MEKIDLKKIKINHKKVNFFRFKKFKKDYLLTNDFGESVFLNPKDFKIFLEGKLNKKSNLYKELAIKGFVKNDFDLNYFLEKYRKKNEMTLLGSGLHIIAVTLRCNVNCIYCQANSTGMNQKGFDMTKETAKKTLDLIFKSSSPTISIEFQGGEPLVNWPIVKFIIEESKRKNKKYKRNLINVMVSNFTLMNKEKLDYLFKNKVGLCTSLDGPRKIHNKNRPLAGKDHYAITTKWIKEIRRREEIMKRKGETVRIVNALLTTTKNSLSYPKEIIDEYVKLGMNGIFLRPLSSLGCSGGKTAKENFGYSIEDFLKFWKKGVDYIFELNKKGIKFHDWGVRYMAQKILTDTDPGYTDMRSPCGAVIGQTLYNYDGKIYTCDEGRMTKDDAFVIGSIEDKHKDIFNNEKVRTMIMSSTLENLTCDNCAYKPYCGVCPVKNYSIHGNLFPNILETDTCKANMYQFDYVFNKIKNKKNYEVVKKWLEDKNLKINNNLN